MRAKRGGGAGEERGGGEGIITLLREWGKGEKENIGRVEIIWDFWKIGESRAPRGDGRKGAGRGGGEEKGKGKMGNEDG